MNRKLQKIISLCIILIFVFCDFSIDILYLKNFPVPYHIPLVNLQESFSVPVIKLQSGSTAYADILCMPPNEGGQTPVFDQNIGLCTLPPLDEYRKCAIPYMYSRDYKKCISNPICTGGQYWDATTKQCVSPQLQGGDESTDLGGNPFPDDKKYCMIDVNGDGTIEENEVFQCDQTPQGYICPQGQAECNPQYNQPICPAGYTYDPATQKCVATVSCPSGGSYDTSTNSCYATPGISCPSDFTYNPTIAKCEVAPGCALGGTYNANTKQCEANANPQCPTGYTYNSATGKCESTPECSQGNYNSSTDKCELSVSPTCSSPYTLGNSGGSNYVCYASPICPSGSTYNTTRDKCETAAGQPSCPPGYSYDSTSGRCQTPATCPSPGYYSYSLGKCTTNYIQTCPSGTTYVNGVCQGSPTIGAPNCGNSSNAGSWTYTWNASVGVCQSNYNPTPLTGLYQMVLNRIPDQSGLNYWNSVFSRPPTYNNILAFINAAKVNYQNRIEVYPPCGSTNYSIMSQCSTLDPETGFTYAEEIMAMYVWYLARCPDSSGYQYWCANNALNWVSGGSNLAGRMQNWQNSARTECNISGCPKPIPSVTSCPCPDNFFTGGYLTCLVQPYYNSRNNKCEFNANAQCPSGTSMQRTPNGYYCVGCREGTYNSNTGKCESSPTNSCPSGYVPSGSSCVSNPYCPSGTTLNVSTGMCQQTTQATPNCPNGFTYNSTYNVCVAAPTCPTMNGVTGTLNPSTDRCEVAPINSCPSGMTYNSSVGKCQQAPTCPIGSMLNTNNDVCETSVTYNCPNGYSYSVTNGMCVSPVNCSSGTLNTTTNQCESSPVYSCPTGYFYVGPTGADVTGVCQGAASCPPGGTLNTTTNRCEADPQCSIGEMQSQGCFTGYSCPLGNYPCQQVGSQWLCSPNTCADIQDEGDLMASGYENDGERDANGNCLGTIYIFNGKKMRCRKSGFQTGFHNCCNESKGKMYDSTGSIGFTSIPDMIKAIAAVYSVIKLGSLVYKAQIVTINLTKNTVNVLTGPGSVVTYSLNSAEGVAIANTMMQYGTQVGQVGNPAEFGATFIPGSASKDVLVGSTMQKYIQELGPQIAWAIAQLALSRIIKDPVLSSAVNLVGTVALMKLGVIPVNYFMIALQVVGLVMALFMARCDQIDIMTSTLNDSKYCHEVGEYCAKKFPVIGCVQKAKGFCCFNSKLARIIHEQGRPQLAGFGSDGGWGQPKNPNCRGFLPEEFQALDFNKIDLSEYMEDIERNMNQNIGSQMQEQFNKSMNDLMGK